MQSSETAPEDNQTARGAGNISRFIKLGAALGILLILGLMAAAVVMALAAADTWGPVIRIVRDVMLLILLLESALLIAALAILMLQLAGFFVMLRAEIKPVLENVRETARLGKATATFVNDNAVAPLIQFKSFLAGLLAFLRELMRIRGLLTSDDATSETLDEADAP
ncbi:MAG: hypothetical protein OXE95_01840 [Chloroflexi bacterium]|nr:hypothetical protein [Chloroflexota bacterium]